MSGNHKAGGSSSRSGDSILQPSKPGPTPRGACRRCKKMKMKCEYVDESGPCNRCRSTSNACSVDPRKAITHKSARSELLRQSQRKDELIAALVQHINRSTSAAETRAGTSGSASTASTPPEADLPEAFMGSSPHVLFPTAAASVTPAETSHLDIVRSGAVRVQEIDELFRFFFVQMNVQLPLLDPNTHHPRAVLDRCPFLFTTILAVAARQLTRPGAYTQALACARKAAADALISESKTVDMCQAYILLGEFLPPAPRWEEDRSSLFRGLAIRLALDLDLGGPNRDRNCTRTWLVCMLLDMHASVGRPPSMPRDGLSRRTRAWSSVPSPVPSDVFLGGAVELFVAASRFQELVAGTSWNREADVNIGGTLRVSEDALAAVVDEWTARFSGSSPSKHWLRFLQQYCKLHMLASILERCGDNVEGLYLRTWHAALAALTELTEKVGPTGLIALSPDVLLRPIVFCSSLIMQLLSPRWRQVVSPESRQVALALVERVIAALDPQPHLNVSIVAVVTAGQAHANTLRMTKEALGAAGVLR